MRSVQRSREPDFLAEIRARYTRWEYLDDHDRHRIRVALKENFGPICAYCQQPCELSTRADDSQRGEIDHFRPRSRFRDHQFDWLNLIYACRRCNQSKDDDWPVHADKRNQNMTNDYRPRYTPVSEYVNPNEARGRRSAHEFFDWDFDTCEIKPSEQLNNLEWSIAQRTIDDIDLNYERSKIGRYDSANLCNRRREQLKFLKEALGWLDDRDEKAYMIRQFTLPDKPFSEFIAAYFRSIDSSTGLP